MRTNDNQASRFGLRESDLQNIAEILSRSGKVEEAILFGSRAKGNYRNGSDVDLALKGDLDLKSVAQLSYFLNGETLMPYKFDIIDYSHIKNNDLKEHIDRVGITIYSKSNTLAA